jgi:hypothetical protein
VVGQPILPFKTPEPSLVKAAGRGIRIGGKQKTETALVWTMFDSPEN